MHPPCVIAWPFRIVEHREPQLPAVEGAVAVARNALFAGVEDADHEQLPVIVRLEKQAVIGGAVAHAAHHAKGRLRIYYTDWLAGCPEPHTDCQRPWSRPLSSIRTVSSVHF